MKPLVCIHGNPTDKPCDGCEREAKAISDAYRAGRLAGLQEAVDRLSLVGDPAHTRLKEYLKGVKAQK